MELVWQLMSVVTVLGLLGAALWWLRSKRLVRLGGRRAGRRERARLEAVERLALSPQHALHLVRVADRVVVVAVHPSGCTLLDNRTWEDLELSARGPARGAAVSGVLR